MFAKLNIDFTIDEYDYGNKIMDYHYGKNVPVIQYHTAISRHCNQLLEKVIPSRFTKDFGVAFMDISNSVVPHTDTNLFVSINHYIQTNDEETIFYSFKEGIKIESFQIQKQKNGFIFKEPQLDIIGSFVAKEKETWILDVATPHSVKVSHQTGRLRKAVVLQTAIHPYEKVIEMLSEQNVL